MTLPLLDVSNHQGRIDFDLLAPHVSGIVAKATQGTGFDDDWYVRNRSECLRLGIPFGAYHWLEPAEAYGAPNEIVEQVRWFRSVLARTDPPDFLDTFDIETTEPGGGRRPGNPSPNDCELAVRVHEDELDHTPMTYGGQQCLIPCAWVRPEIVRCRLWKAIYPFPNNGDPAAKNRGYGTLGPWSEISLWQWTSGGKGLFPPGSVESAGLDVNEVFVDLNSIMLRPEQPPASKEEPMICTPSWAQPIDDAGILFPHYSWDFPFFRAWYGAPVVDATDHGFVANPFGIPCVEVNALGWLEGHGIARGPIMLADETKVGVYRDDGRPLVYDTGHPPVVPGVDEAKIVEAVTAALGPLIPKPGDLVDRAVAEIVARLNRR